MQRVDIWIKLVSYSRYFKWLSFSGLDPKTYLVPKYFFDRTMYEILYKRLQNYESNIRLLDMYVEIWLLWHRQVLNHYKYNKNCKAWYHFCFQNWLHIPYTQIILSQKRYGSLIFLNVQWKKHSFFKLIKVSNTKKRGWVMSILYRNTTTNVIFCTD